MEDSVRGKRKTSNQSAPKSGKYFVSDSDLV